MRIVDVLFSRDRCSFCALLHTCFVAAITDFDEDMIYRQVSTSRPFSLYISILASSQFLQREALVYRFCDYLL